MPTITDDFNRADADALGTSAEGWSWTEVVGDVDILNNQARAPSGQNSHIFARAEQALSSDKHYAQADITPGSDIPGCFLSIRASDDAAPNEDHIRGGFTEAGLHIQKVVDGAVTNLATRGEALIIVVTTRHVKLEVDDTDTFTLTVEGFDPLTYQEAGLFAGNVKVGISGFIDGTANEEIDWNNFEAADLFTSQGVTSSVFSIGFLELVRV